MISIPEGKKRHVTTDLNLLAGMPVEKALGMQWDTMKYYYLFQHQIQ